jgi:hypothetical protein
VGHLDCFHSLDIATSVLKLDSDDSLDFCDVCCFFSFFVSDFANLGHFPPPFSQICQGFVKLIFLLLLIL